MEADWSRIFGNILDQSKFSFYLLRSECWQILRAFFMKIQKKQGYLAIPCVGGTHDIEEKRGVSPWNGSWLVQNFWKYFRPIEIQLLFTAVWMLTDFESFFHENPEKTRISCNPLCRGDSRLHENAGNMFLHQHGTVICSPKFRCLPRLSDTSFVHRKGGNHGTSAWRMGEIQLFNFNHS